MRFWNTNNNKINKKDKFKKNRKNRKKKKKLFKKLKSLFLKRGPIYKKLVKKIRKDHHYFIKKKIRKINNNYNFNNKN
jgi:hypothetical protein